jgi:hypothetical protein
MPRGVEHVFGEGYEFTFTDVSIPLMPRGVEHNIVDIDGRMAYERDFL